MINQCFENPIKESTILKWKKKLSDGTARLDDFILPLDITPEQTLKGLAWLMKDAAKRDSPYGDKERYIIENFEKFQLLTFVETATRQQLDWGIHWYLPVYRVYSKDGLHFDYYYNFVNTHIVG